MSTQPDDNGLPAVPSIDKLIHEPARLLLLAWLYVVESADFTFLMNQTGLTWGNLSSHMTKLEDAGFIAVEKAFKERKPNTMLSLTPAGRAAFKAYKATMQQLFAALPD